jgi:hypothetical protein
MNMKYCPGCGREVRAGANFCGRCGHRLNSAGRESIETENSVEPGTSYHLEKPVKPVRRKKHGKALITVLFLVLLVIGALYVSPFGKFKLPFGADHSHETGLKNTGDNNSSNGAYPDLRINVAHRDGKSPSPGPGSDEIDDEKPDPGKINQATKTIEDALLSGDQARFRDILTDNALSLYGKDLQGINREELVKFGEAFKSREMKTFSSLYTEYVIRLDGQEFTVSVARQKDGSWKIMRF